MYSGCDYGQECGQIRVRENDMWSSFQGEKKQIKTPPPAAKKRIESREETHNPSHVVFPTRSNENYVVRHRSNHMVKLCGRSREQHIIPSPQVLYCNSSSSGCQGPLKIKNSTQNLIRSKQRKSSSRSFPSSRR